LGSAPAKADINKVIRGTAADGPLADLQVFGRRV